MSDKEFDKYFRNRLQGQSSSVPADMWQRIHPEDRRRKGFFFWIWWLAGPAFLLIGYYMVHRLYTPTPTTIHIPIHTSIPSSLRNSIPVVKATPVTKQSPSSHPPDGIEYRSCSLPGLAITRGAFHPIRPTALPNPAKKQPAENKPAPKRYIDAYVSPDIPFIQGRAFSYSAGIRVSQNFGPHFSGKIGLQYSQTGQRMAQHDTLRTYSVSIRVKSLDIPVLIGYQSAFGSFKAALNAGIIINAHTWGTSLYKSHTGTSLYAGLNAEEGLNKRLSLFMEPYFRLRLSNMNNGNAYPFAQKFNGAGLLIGLRYDLSTLRQQKEKK